jgi:hypothetical protein
MAHRFVAAARVPSLPLSLLLLQALIEHVTRRACVAVSGSAPLWCAVALTRRRCVRGLNSQIRLADDDVRP